MEAIASRGVVAVAVRVVLGSNQADSRPGVLEDLVPYLVDLAEKDLVDLAEKDLVVSAGTGLAGLVGLAA